MEAFKIKTLFLECNMGAAGDMLMGALLELHENPIEFLTRLNAIGIPNVSISASPSDKCGIVGTHITVIISGKEEHSVDIHHHNHEDEHEHTHEHIHEDEHEHTHEHIHEDVHFHSMMNDIEHLIEHLDISNKVKRDAKAVYNLIADAESHIHGVPVKQIHFHEVGNMDAVADIIGVCMLMEELSPELILSSPVHVGSGQVKCSHGILPVPAPATVRILRDIPIYSSDIKGELCTPTGAALLKYFVKKFDVMPVMTISKIGYGMGKKDFKIANCVRAFIGEVGKGGDEVTELICNLDDMTPEEIAFIQQLLLEEGALDVYTSPIGMKKGRSGILFTCMCHSEFKDKMIRLIFRHTTTIGLRENISRRYTLSREKYEMQTKYGAVNVKTSSGYGVTKSKPEYDDIAKIAHEKGLSISDIMKEVREKLNNKLN